MSIGKILKETREKKNVGLNKAYEQTRIHPDVLKALEEDDYARISSPAYVKSFLKEYASYLGLDTNAIIDEYNRSKQPKQKRQRTTEAGQEKTTSFDLSGLLNIVFSVAKWVIILIIAIVAVRGAVRLTKNIKAKASVEVSKKKQAAKKQETIKKKQESVLQGIVIPKDQDLVLSIYTTDDAWLNLKVDGEITFEGILKKGASEKWQAKENFEIWTGKAEALKLNLNGNNIGTPGKGIVKNLVIDREGIKK